MNHRDKAAELNLEKGLPNAANEEKFVLAAAMIDVSGKHVPEIIGALSSEDFLLEKHRRIFRAICRLHEREEAVDRITVAHELMRNNELESVDGLSYLVELENGMPALDNISAYLNIVLKVSKDRKLAYIGNALTNAALSGVTDPEELASEVAEALAKLAEHKNTVGLMPIADVIRNHEGGLNSFLAPHARETGIKTGFERLDQMTRGLHPGEVTIIAARPSMGKAQPISSPVITSNGTWTPIGKLSIGDPLGSVDGRMSLVTGIFPQGIKPVYRVTFSDGRSTLACGDHLWSVSNRKWANEKVLPTKRIAKLLEQKQNQRRLSIPLVTGDFNVEDKQYPLSPWLMGYLLGNGCMCKGTIGISIPDNSTVARVRSELKTVGCMIPDEPEPGSIDYRVSMINTPKEYGELGKLRNELKKRLDQFGLLGLHSHEKFVPQAYLNGSIAQRGELLKGLLDSDGTAEKHSSVSFSSSSEQLAIDVQYLVRSMGGCAKMSDRIPSYSYKGEKKKGLRSYKVSIMGLKGSICFSLERKQLRAESRISTRRSLLSFVSVEYAGEEQCVCISVSHYTQTYITNDFIVTHNTALALNIAWHVGVRLGKPVAIFSLEMPKEALLLRMICAAARVDSARFMSGYLNQGERQKIRTAAQEAIDSPIWIDDASDATVNDMHGRLQEFERKIGRSIGVTVVDYLQLMTSKEKSRNDNRTTEVGAISRGLKILSKKMNCPFLVLSQLSRACETRNEHRPQLSDLRESGCLAGDVLIALSDSGLYVPIRELVGVESLYVWAVNEKTRRSVKMPGRAFKSGTKQVFSLTTRLGKKIRATANHKFLTIGGWVPLGDLKILDRIALPRVLSPSLQQTIPDEELAFMAHMIGNGTALPRQPIHYVSGDPVLAEATCIYAKAIWGDAVNVRWQKSKAGNWWEAFFSSSKRVSRKHHSPVVVWLKQMGMYGKRAPEKEIPAVVFRQPQDAVARFLMHLWSTDGCYSGPCPYYSTTSEALARGVQSLLLRIGVTAILKPKKEGVYRDSWTVTVSGAEDVMRFLNVVGAIGTNRMAAAQRLREETESLEPNTNRDSFPASVWETHILPMYKGQGYTQRAFQAAIGSAYSGTSLYNQNIGRCRLKRIADTLHSSELLAMAEGDVYWDEVSEIREDGIEDVFDIEVPILHNFVASDMYVHNSIEQDADNIMAIFREEVYKRDREDLRGLAELVILKQRNGPVGEVKLIWLAQQTRFESRAEDIEPMDGSLPYAD